MAETKATKLVGARMTEEDKRLLDDIAVRYGMTLVEVQGRLLRWLVQQPDTITGVILGPEDSRGDIDVEYLIYKEIIRRRAESLSPDDFDALLRGALPSAARPARGGIPPKKRAIR